MIPQEISTPVYHFILIHWLVFGQKGNKSEVFYKRCTAQGATKQLGYEIYRVNDDALEEHARTQPDACTRTHTHKQTSRHT